QRYRPPQPYGSMFGGDLYDGEIAFMDAQVGRLLDRLRARKRWGESLVVVASDHGEALGQHGEPTHAVLAYDSTLRVALLIKPPRAAGIAPGVEAGMASHRDILPTVARLLGLPVPREVQGAALLAGDDAGPAPRRERPIYFECLLPRFGYGWAPLFGLRAEGWKYIQGPEPELYRVAGDADELFDLSGQEEEIRARYEELLFSLIRRDGAPAELLASGGNLDPEARAKLAALGYVSGGEVALSDLTPREPTGRVDPRVAVALLGDYFAANTAAARGQYELAAQIYETILLPLDPENPTFLTSLGDVRRSLGDLEAAVDAYRRAQAVDSQNSTIYVELGRLEMDRGRLEEAEDLLAAARQLAPEDLSAAYFLARVAQRREFHEGAAERFREALALDASHYDSRVQLAVELGRLDRLEEARRELLVVLEESPFFSRAHYNLGIVELRVGNHAAAVAAMERALRYRAEYVEARYALAVARARSGDAAGARREIETLVARHPESEQATAARRLLEELGGGG
ncbi:MAG: tetratricopeptide repeat protein, partial [Thermoanaerobaculia bacterium]